MGRPRKKPDYDPNKIMNDLLDVVVEEYKKTVKPNSHIEFANLGAISVLIWSGPAFANS